MTGGKGVLRSAWMLYHFVGSSRSERMYLVVMSAGFRAMAASFRVAHGWTHGPASQARNSPTVDEDPRPVKAWGHQYKRSLELVFTILSTSLSGIPRINMPVMNNRIASAGAGKAKCPQSVPITIRSQPTTLTASMNSSQDHIRPVSRFAQYIPSSAVSGAH